MPRTTEICRKRCWNPRCGNGRVDHLPDPDPESPVKSSSVGLSVGRADGAPVVGSRDGTVVGLSVVGTAVVGVPVVGVAVIGAADGASDGDGVGT